MVAKLTADGPICKTPRCVVYDGPSVKEKIFKKKIHHRILGGENIFKYIFTTVFCWEKIYLNIFSPPYFVGRKYI